MLCLCFHVPTLLLQLLLPLLPYFAPIHFFYSFDMEHPQLRLLVTLTWVVEIYHVEFRLNFILVSMLQQMIIGNGRKIVKLEIVNVHAETLLNLLFNVIVYNSIRFTRTRCPQHNRCPKRVYDIYPTVIPFIFVIKLSTNLFLSLK